MGSVNDAYTAIKTATETVVTDYRELPNPYFIEANSITFLRKGYAISFGSARDAPQREYNSTWSLQFFDIWLTREVITLESDPDPIRNTVSALHTDLLAVLKAVLDPTIYESGINYVETSAPEMLDTDKQILSMKVTVVARTQDTLI
jgi:hypothetical protein